MNPTTPKQCAQCPTQSETVVPSMDLDYREVPLCAACREYVKSERLTAAYELYGAEFAALEQ